MQKEIVCKLFDWTRTGKVTLLFEKYLVQISSQWCPKGVFIVQSQTLTPTIEGRRLVQVVKLKVEVYLRNARQEEFRKEEAVVQLCNVMVEFEMAKGYGGEKDDTRDRSSLTA